MVPSTSHSDARSTGSTAMRSATCATQTYMQTSHSVLSRAPTAGLVAYDPHTLSKPIPRSMRGGSVDAYHFSRVPGPTRVDGRVPRALHGISVSGASFTTDHSSRCLGEKSKGALSTSLCVPHYQPTHSPPSSATNAEFTWDNLAPFSTLPTGPGFKEWHDLKVDESISTNTDQLTLPSFSTLIASLPPDTNSAAFFDAAQADAAAKRDSARRARRIQKLCCPLPGRGRRGPMLTQAEREMHNVGVRREHAPR